MMIWKEISLNVSFSMEFFDYHTISLNVPFQFVEMRSRLADMCASKINISNDEVHGTDTQK